MSGARVVVQILISLLIVAMVMPVVLAFVPIAQNPGVGPPAAVVLAVAVFVILRLGWPRPAR